MSKSNTSLEQLDIAIKLAFPVINICTFELSRAEMTVKESAERVGKHFQVMPFTKLPTPKHIEEIGKEATKKNKNGAVIFDAFFFDRIKVNPETLPAIKSSLSALEKGGINYVIAGKETLAEEFCYHLDLPAMNMEEIKDLLSTCEKNIEKNGDLFTDVERDIIANNALGLSHTQMSNVFTYSAYLKYKEQDYLAEIRKEKAHILKDVGLDVLEPIAIDDVGGLDNLKEFLFVRKAGWDKGLPVKGVLLAGVPGGGKTLTAKAAASVLGTTLVRLDMGRFYSKYLGETERQFNRALHTIEQIAPVVVLIDEVEKFFGNSDGEHEVSKRLLGSFLYWLQERKNKVFIVATANRVGALPPELMRSGRWDKAFFIDLPTAVERETIFKIHITKNAPEVEPFELNRLVHITEGYTGAEIEQAVVDAMYLANSKDVPFCSEILEEAVEAITPTSETRKEDINEIRGLKSRGFYPANEELNEIEAARNRMVSLD